MEEKKKSLNDFIVNGYSNQYYKCKERPGTKLTITPTTQQPTITFRDLYKNIKKSIKNPIANLQTQPVNLQTFWSNVRMKNWCNVDDGGKANARTLYFDQHRYLRNHIQNFVPALKDAINEKIESLQPETQIDILVHIILLGREFYTGCITEPSFADYIIGGQYVKSNLTECVKLNEPEPDTESKDSDSDSGLDSDYDSEPDNSNVESGDSNIDQDDSNIDQDDSNIDQDDSDSDASLDDSDSESDASLDDSDSESDK